MLKAVVRTILAQLGYSIHRIPATIPPAASQPRVAPRLRPVHVDLFPGFSVEVDLGDEMPRKALREGNDYEAPSPRLLRALCSDAGDVFFDVGANFGFYSYFMLAHGAPVTIHSFEPNPAHVARQQATAKRWSNRFFPHQLGLSDQVGQLSLTVSSLDTGWSTFGPNPHFTGIEPTLTRHLVPITTFDAWRITHGLDLPSSPRWVLKMDVEGFELKALHGMKEALRAQAFKALLIEILDHTLNFCGATAAEIFAFMDAVGYAAFDLQLQPTVHQPPEARNVLFLPKAHAAGQ